MKLGSLAQEAPDFAPWLRPPVKAHLADLVKHYLLERHGQSRGVVHK